MSVVGSHALCAVDDNKANRRVLTIIVKRCCPTAAIVELEDGVAVRARFARGLPHMCVPGRAGGGVLQEARTAAA
jgi:hypothetical protein